MKKITLIMAFVICMAMLFSCGEPEARDILDEEGNVIAVGYYDGDDLLYEEHTDSNGKLTKKITYDDKERVEKEEKYSFGTVSKESVYTYGEEEGSYNVTTTSFNKKGIVTSVVETKYENERPVSETRNTATASDSGDVEEVVFTYNDEDGSVVETISSNGVKIRETMSDSKGVLLYDHVISNSGSSVKTFYEGGSVISKIENYNAAGELLITVVNEYGEDGKIIGTKSYGADGALKDYSKYVYNDSTLIGIYKYYADGTIHSTIAYDSEGKATIHSGMYIHLG